ncbi:MAG: VOC family protein [Burkholderiaceae bacterium]|nr:VOC family protein [Burkholderiaceae bacterium]GIL05195.1 MAG: glyoxalase [Betaproteobacteria bacterium]
MDTMQLHRGRLIDHVHLIARDLAATKRFYAAVLAALGRKIEGEGEHYFWSDELFVSTADEHTRGATRVHLAFQAADREAVQRFHEAALAAGGTDNGAPGLRPYHADYYAAFVIDPDGNNIEAVYHGPSQRSADSVRIAF